ncbi:MAG: ATP-binding protein [Planctomycetes bacterium]|nr:ATP-binding protein [Planctomycetota bacterium]NOG53946.1 ATP-binding protein [Planctomycetota bacterium]
MSDSPHLRIELLSQPRYLAPARAMVAALSQRYGFSDCEGNQIALALDEALCNVINHGYERRSDGPIWISVWPIDDPPNGIKIRIEDNGRQVDLTTIRSRNLDDVRPGGLGVFIMKRIMDDVEYTHRPGGGMQLVLTKRKSHNTSCGEDPLAVDGREDPHG